MSYEGETRSEFFTDQTLYLKPIHLFRNWRVVLTDGGFRLASLTAQEDNIWPADGEAFTAKCHAFHKRGHIDDPRVPSADCQCGIYGTHEFKAEDDPETLWYSKGTIYGTMDCWGRIEDHKKEAVARAECAYPVSLTHFMCQECARVLPLDQAGAAIVESNSLLRYRGNMVFAFRCLECGVPSIERASYSRDAQELIHLLHQEYF